MSGGPEPRAVIVGAGFGGLACARALRAAPVRITIVDSHNYTTFTPFLYQLATALLEPSEVVQPVRRLLHRMPDADFRLATVTGVDLDARIVQTDRGALPYDYLVLAAGAVNNYFGNHDIAQRSSGLGTLSEALALRDEVLDRFEQAAWTTDAEQRRRLLSFAVVGGGPTGVEFAGAFAELVHRVLRAAQRALEGKHVEVISGALASDIDGAGLHLQDGRVIPAATVVWAAGVRAVPLADELGLAQGSHARIEVTRTLQVHGRPEVLAIGDLAAIPQDGDGPLPMLAQVAIQSGRHAAEVILATLHGRGPEPFRYRDLGTMATQGRDAAVAQIGPVKLSGRLGWLAWLVIHIARIAGLRTRLLVLANWAAGYLFTDRPVRLIAGPDRRPDDHDDHDAEE